ncbi:MAG: histidine phosphatase family protein [Thermoflexales bacterium]
MEKLPANAERLILVKHSLPEIVDGVRARDWRLSEEGRRRCDALADALAAYAPSGALTSSDEPKAIETAERVAARLGLPAAVDADLSEHKRGSKKLLDETEWQAAMARLFAHPNRLEYGEETGDQARLRFETAIRRALAAHVATSSGACVCVCHGTVISLFTVALAGVDGYALWRRLELPSFVVLSLADKRLEALWPAAPG